MKKGFTLVELLAVIVVLGVISLITMPVINNVILENKNKAYKRQVDEIIRASKTWSLKNEEKITEDKINFVTVEELINEGVIEQEELINPINGVKMDGCVKIIFSKFYNQYEYNYHDYCDNIYSVKLLYNGSSDIRNVGLNEDAIFEVVDIDLIDKKLTCDNDATITFNGNIVSVSNITNNITCSISE